MNDAARPRAGGGASPHISRACAKYAGSKENRALKCGSPIGFRHWKRGHSL